MNQSVYAAWVLRVKQFHPISERTLYMMVAETCVALGDTCLSSESLMELNLYSRLKVASPRSSLPTSAP